MSLLKQAPPPEPVNRVEFNAAIIHFYRGELSRADNWRQRLDTTTNWAVVTTAAAISFVFGERGNSHIVLPIVSLLVFFFLLVEARRYRHYDIWQNRLRLLETDYFAPMFQGYSPGQTWRDLMARDLQRPRFRISLLEAMGWRMRRNYIWIFAILLLAWIIKITTFPNEISSFGDVVTRAAVPPIPGSVMILIGVIFNAVVLWVAFATSGLRGASGEIIARDEPVEFDAN